jgi:hypothetical protein
VPRKIWGKVCGGNAGGVAGCPVRPSRF